MEFPAPGDEGFARADPSAVGLDPAAVEDAVEFHLTTGTPPEQVAYDFSNQEPWDESEGELGYTLGPMPDRRGGPAGLILKGGRLVAEWGDTRRVDHSFSVAKSFLSVVAGVAWDRGLFELDGRVADSEGHADDGGFDSEQNESITWRHLLQQTSEWEGTLFDRPDSVDRNRGVGKTGGPGKGEGRDLEEPGTHWEYNDVRINRLALSLLRLWAKPLPRVLAHEVLDPAGATRTWEWHGYHNSDVEVEGRTMRSVSGGGHWGGGLWASARDLARAGHLLLAEGRWEGTRLLSADWVERAIEPCPENPNYGFLLWLNTDRTLWPSAPESAYAMLGHGQNVVWVDPEHDLVVVLRWLALSDDREGREDLPNQDRFLRRLLDGV
ncbi:serine hydrolase domain-containing protein [Halobaculum sp. EA56]|uniref:serine hydrolase domain-containing protein n=1 Tax=Halobaculum sp. EA56 TaxID=3421648 RepID=UPI003EBFB60F